jgi:hypothetical protein
MSQKFEYEFEELKHNHITFDYGPDDDEVLNVVSVDGTPMLCMNRSGMLALAKLLIKMGLGPYSDGFHVHLYSNFNAGQPECLIVGLIDEKPGERAK